MGAEGSFPTANWFRSTRRLTSAAIFAHCLKDNELPVALEIVLKEATIAPLIEQGWSNFTYLVIACDNTRWLLRIKKKPKNVVTKLWSDYHKERWCLSLVHSHLPAPHAPESGIGYFKIKLPNSDQPEEFSYMLQEYIDADPASYYKELSVDPKFYRRLGEIAREINLIKVDGVGGVFDPYNNRLSINTLDELFEKEYALLEPTIRVWFSSKKEIYRCIKDRFLSLRSISKPITLAHRDFLSNWGNILVSPKHIVTGVIDWEFAYGGPAFYLELASFNFTLIRDGVSATERERKLNWVLEGYRITKREFNSQHRDLINTFTLWHALRTIHKYMEFKYRGDMKSEPWRRLFADRASRYVKATFGVKRGMQKRSSQRVRKAA